jgi:cell division septal protein FtsQ
MKKFYRIFLLLIIFIFLSTYSPNKFDLTLENNSDFFKINKIVILNNLLVKKSNVKEKLGQIYTKNIFLIERKDIEESLKEIDFLEKVEVKKKYPNTIIVKIFETKPVGVLFKDKDKYILDSSSNLISFDGDLNFDQLPSIFGDDAENNFINFFNQLKVNNFPRKKIKKFYYFKIGRWDLQLANSKTIKFPYNVTNDIIKKSVELLDRKDFKNYNIIDLRVDGKIIVE